MGDFDQDRRHFAPQQRPERPALGAQVFHVGIAPGEIVVRLDWIFWASSRDSMIRLFWAIFLMILSISPIVLVVVAFSLAASSLTAGSGLKFKKNVSIPFRGFQTEGVHVDGNEQVGFPLVGHDGPRFQGDVNVGLPGQDDGQVGLGLEDRLELEGDVQGEVLLFQPGRIEAARGPCRRGRGRG